MGKCVDRGVKNREKVIRSSILLSSIIWVTKTDEKSDKAGQTLRGQSFEHSWLKFLDRPKSSHACGIKNLEKPLELW